MSTEKKPLLLSGAQLKAFKEEPSQWIVDGLLRLGRRRISLLAGKPEGGKSTIARQLAVAVTKGKPFMERATLRGSVIYWQSEEEPADVRDSLDHLGYDHTKDEKLLTFFGNAADNHIVNLREQLLEHPDVRLVIVETLDDLLKLSDIKENSAARAAFDKFDTVVVNDFCKNTAFLALHQLKKRDTESVGDMLLGATTIRGRTDAKWYVQRVSDEDPRRIFQATVRKGLEILPVFLDYNTETETSTLGHSLADERKQSTQRTEERIVGEIAQFFTNNPDTSFEGDCLRVISGNTNEKWRVFKKMLMQGLLMKSGKGTKNSPFTYKVAAIVVEGEAA
jgi:AAA domain-containing protein